MTGLYCNHWATRNIFGVKIGGVEYKIPTQFKSGNPEGVANMIINSDKNKEQCRKIATIMRLADYGTQKQSMV